jgi:hypothetical protein
MQFVGVGAARASDVVRANSSFSTRKNLPNPSVVDLNRKAILRRAAVVMIASVLLMSYQAKPLRQRCACAWSQASAGHAMIFRIPIGLILLTFAFLPLPIAAKVIKAESAYACNSPEAHEIFQQFILSRDYPSQTNALRNGDCINLPFGTDVEVLPGNGDFMLSAIRIPGYRQKWWIAQLAFLSAIEQERLFSEMKKLTQEFKKDKSTDAKTAVTQVPLTQNKMWFSVPAAIPVELSHNKTTAEMVFRDTKDSVWAVSTFAGSGSEQILSQGSAVAVSPTHLITNCHVTSGASRIVISQEATRHDVILLSRDTTTDRCILVSRRTLPFHVRGIRRFSELQIGERVFTVGSPRGLEHTLGDGLVSGLRAGTAARYIQTSAPISPGSSGGGLFDSAGNLLGITTFMLKDSQALNFAIAAEDFWRSE